MASTLRHLLAWQAREDLDPESGLHHLAHARADLGMLLELVLTGHGNDDRSELAVGLNLDNGGGRAED